MLESNISVTSKLNTFYQLLKASFLGLIYLSIASSFSCQRPPNYEVVPVIEFVSLSYIDYPGPRPDTILINIRFTDGDGDLGLNGEETNPPYDFRITGEVLNSFGDTIEILTNLNHYNYFCDFYIKKGNNFERILDFNPDDGIPYQVPVNPFYYRFPILNTTQKKGPLEGNLQIALANAFFQRFDGVGTFEPTDTLKVRIYIKDRALNNSNVVESQQFTIPPFQ